jgi:hypothetical protein
VGQRHALFLSLAIGPFGMNELHPFGMNELHPFFHDVFVNFVVS